MTQSPKYRLNKSPAFSLNHLASYLSTVNATQRAGVIRKAKFTRVHGGASSYSQARNPIERFFRSNIGDLSYFDDPIDRLEKKSRREIDGKRDEALRCIRGLEAFKTTYLSKRWTQYTFLPSADKFSMSIEGVKVNISLNTSLTAIDRDGAIKSGGAIAFFAGTKDTRKNVEDRRKHAAAMIYWALELRGNIEPLPRLCFSIDVFGNHVEKASSSTDRFRSMVRDACQEVAGKWHNVEEPAGYDGPAWR